MNRALGPRNDRIRSSMRRSSSPISSYTASFIVFTSFARST